jgi:hypothetical protein
MLLALLEVAFVLSFAGSGYACLVASFHGVFCADMTHSFGIRGQSMCSDDRRFCVYRCVWGICSGDVRVEWCCVGSRCSLCTWRR